MKAAKEDLFLFSTALAFLGGNLAIRIPPACLTDGNGTVAAAAAATAAALFCGIRLLVSGRSGYIGTGSLAAVLAAAFLGGAAGGFRHAAHLRPVGTAEAELLRKTGSPTGVVEETASYGREPESRRLRMTVRFGNERILVYTDWPDRRRGDVRPGDSLRVRRLRPAPVKNFTDRFDYPGWLARRGIRSQAFCRSRDLSVIPEQRPALPYRFARMRTQFAERLTVVFGESPETAAARGIAVALITGDRTRIPPEIQAGFRDSGTYHLLALSGLHIGILYRMLQRLLWWLPGISGPRARIRSLLILSVLWLYAAATGLSPSIFRAVLTATCYEAGQWREEPGNGVHALSLSALIISAIDPGAPREAGFQLSFLAMAGIFFLHPPLERLIVPFLNGIPSPFRTPVRRIWSMLSVSLACQTATLPLTLPLFGTFPLSFQLANLLAAPLTALSLQLLPAALLLDRILPLPGPDGGLPLLPLRLLAFLVSLLAGPG